MAFLEESSVASLLLPWRKVDKGRDTETCLHHQKSHFLLGQSDGSFGNKLSQKLCKFSVNFILSSFYTKNHIHNSFGALSCIPSLYLFSHLSIFLGVFLCIWKDAGDTVLASEELQLSVRHGGEAGKHSPNVWEVRWVLKLGVKISRIIIISVLSLLLLEGTHQLIPGPM